MDKTQKDKLVQEAIEQTKGDVIIATVGDDAKNVVVGKNIQQEVTDTSQPKAASEDDLSPPATTPAQARAETLRQILHTHFNKSELRDLCFEMHIIYEDLSGDTRNDKVLELIDYCIRHGRLEELQAHCQQLRPGAFQQE